MWTLEVIKRNLSFQDCHTSLQFSTMTAIKTKDFYLKRLTAHSWIIRIFPADLKPDNSSIPHVNHRD